MKSYILGWLVFIGGILLGGFAVGFFSSLKIKGLEDLIKFKDSMIHRLEGLIGEGEGKNEHP